MRSTLLSVSNVPCPYYTNELREPNLYRCCCLKCVLFKGVCRTGNIISVCNINGSLTRTRVRTHARTNSHTCTRKREHTKVHVSAHIELAHLTRMTYKLHFFQSGTARCRARTATAAVSLAATEDPTEFRCAT